MSKISVIIPTLNAAEHLPELFHAIQLQAAAADEIIIIDSSSDDQTAMIAKDDSATVITIQRKEYDHGRTRTLAAQQASGDILIFMTQDALPVNADSFSKLIETLRADNEIAAVYGRQIPDSKASHFAGHLRCFNYPDTSSVYSFEDRKKYGLRTAFLSNSFAAYRKQDLAAIGYFKEGLIYGEDMHAAARLLAAGKKIAYNAQAKVFHSHNYSVFDDFRRYFDMGIFHVKEPWLLETFGKPGRLGYDFLKSEYAYLSNRRQYHLIPVSFLRSAMKYAGYKLGKTHRLLPWRLKGRMTSNPAWIEQNRMKNKRSQDK